MTGMTIEEHSRRLAINSSRVMLGASRLTQSLHSHATPDSHTSVLTLYHKLKKNQVQLF